MFPGWRHTKIAIIHGVTLAASCWISYWLITHILGHSIAVSRDDDFLGGMWATIATLFVYRFSYEQSIGAALSRMTSTAVSFVLCLVYLLMFPFHLWGLAALIGIGTVMMSLIGRPDDIVNDWNHDGRSHGRRRHQSSERLDTACPAHGRYHRRGWRRRCGRMVESTLGRAVVVGEAAH